MRDQVGVTAKNQPIFVGERVENISDCGLKGRQGEVVGSVENEVNVRWDAVLNDPSRPQDTYPWPAAWLGLVTWEDQVKK